MTNNNTPTAPGEYWYRRTPRGTIEPVYAGGYSVDGVLLYKYAWSNDVHNVEDDGLWRGPVPMECDACHGSGASMFCPHCGEVIA